MLIETRAIEAIKPYENNPRDNDGAVDAVVTSLREFGFRQPIVVDAEGVIVVGHTRWKAARKLGLTQVPVHVAADLTPEQARAYRLADNKTNEIADWDFQRLPIELAQLKDDGFELGLLGFSIEELAKIMGDDPREGLCDPDEVPAPPDEAVTQPGDLWILGEHRLMCGDSASPEDVDRLLDGAVIHLLNADPPYNVKVEPRSNNAFVTGKTTFHPVPLDCPQSGQPVRATTEKLRAKDRPLENDCVSKEEFDQLLTAWFENASRVMVPGGGFYIWGGYANLGNYPAPLQRAGLYFSQGIVWDKQHPVLSRKDYMGAFELCFYGWKEGAAHRYFGPNNETDLWHVKKVNPQSMIHLTEKPVELAARAIQYSSLEGENVLDLFGGSGSTLIACEQLGRHSYLMEIDPLYCDVIVKRFENFSGQTARRLPAADL